MEAALQPNFFTKVYEKLATLPLGSYCTYGQLAEASGSPGASRAVGQAMRRNPHPVVVPCHRVLPSHVFVSGDLGNYTSKEGPPAKRRLLVSEGANLRLLCQKHLQSSLHADALGLLSKRDRRLAALIRRYATITMPFPKNVSLFGSLVRSIIGQQLSTIAARSVFTKLTTHVGTIDTFEPDTFLKVSPNVLRGSGLSRAKVKAVLDLSEKMRDGKIPTDDQVLWMSDDEVIARLTEVHGIGVWTAHMALIFQIGRPDVFPIGDLGIRKGLEKLVGARRKLSEERLERLSEDWKPYRSVVSWYLWRSLDDKTATT